MPCVTLPSLKPVHKSIIVDLMDVPPFPHVLRSLTINPILLFQIEETKARRLCGTEQIGKIFASC